MSIKGFTVEGQDYQYNYPNLDNLPEITPESIGAVSQEDFSAFEEEAESQIEQNKDDISALKSASYNLLDPTGITPYQSTARAELTRTGFIIKNTTEATYSRGYLYLTLEPNTEYTFSAKKHTTSGVAYVGYSEAPAEGEPFPSANIPLIGRTAPDDETISKTFTTTTGILVIRFYAAWDTAELGEVEYSEIMVVEGTEGKPYVRHVFAQDDEARNRVEAAEEKLTELDDLSGEVDDLKRAVLHKDNLAGRWANVSLVSSSGNLSATNTERSTLSIYVPKDVVSFSCRDVNSCVAAYRGSEYIGVWNGTDGFAKSFKNVDYVDFQKLFSDYPMYNFRIVVYCYPADIDQYITIMRTRYSDVLSVVSKINTLGKYIESYYKVAQGLDSNLIYAANTGLFAENIARDGVNAIHCSGLVYAALCKIVYQNSRYNGLSKNVNSGLFWMTDGSVPDLDYMPAPYIYPDFLRADQLAKYFDGKGELIPFDPVHNNIQPGDIVFYGGSGESGYKGVTHVCVALNYVELTGVIRAVDGSSGEKTDGSPAGVNYSQLAVANHNVYYTKINIVNEIGTTVKVSEGHTLPNQITAGSVKTVSDRRNLSYDNPFGFYTVIIDGPAMPDILYYVQELAYTGNGRDQNVSAISRQKTASDKQIINIAIPDTAHKLNAILINVQNNSDADIDLPTLRYRVYTGWLDADPEP